MQRIPCRFGPWAPDFGLCQEPQINADERRFNSRQKAQNAEKAVRFFYRSKRRKRRFASKPRNTKIREDCFSHRNPTRDLHPTCSRPARDLLAICSRSARDLLAIHRSSSEFIGVGIRKLNSLSQPGQKFLTRNEHGLTLSNFRRNLSAATQRLAHLYEQRLAALEAMKKSLLQEAFTGKL